MYKMIVSDLDETLLNDEHQICERNVQAIKKAFELGIKFIPSTGRGYWAIQNVLEALDLIGKEGQYVISFNGCAIVENKENKTLVFNELPFEKANELFQNGLTKDVCIHIYTPDTVYLYNVNEDEKNRFINQKNDFVEILEPSIGFLKDTPIAKLIYQNTDTSYLMKISDEMKSITEGVVSVSYSSGRYLELNRFGVNKGDAMLDLAKILGIKKEEIIAVGDNFNDLPMLRVAGLGVAAGNAVEGVKEVCGYVCKNDNNQGVLAEVIEKFIL
ncbi:MAG: Cof-type HAD-IIB family hydrolase [Clostridiaceae bacterium]